MKVNGTAVIFDEKRIGTIGDAVAGAVSTKRNMNEELPLIFKDGHLFVELEGDLWLFDTGAPTSFGAITSIMIAATEFRLATNYFGLTNTTLSCFVGVPCVGLLGADILGNFDHIIDTISGTLTISVTELEHSGHTVRLSEFMGIPILTSKIADTTCRMFFDTGAQISYFQGDSLSNFPSAGSVTDFYPGVGQFQTDTYQVEVALEGVAFTVRCGTLPSLLGATLMMADTQGIIGNQILNNRVIGFFPRGGVLYL